MAEHPIKTLKALRAAEAQCTRCPLYRRATQVVPGEGLLRARLMLVGEQPGDQEDRQGKPFVGPAGRILSQALDDAGIVRAEAFVTNAVKHFKFEERGKRRIHKKPSDSEISACKPWLWAELSLIKPEIIVCLGASAARSVIGRQHRVLKERGHFFDHPMARSVTATVHPSSILRAPDSETRHREYAAFVSDLKAVRNKLHKLAKAG